MKKLILAAILMSVIGLGEAKALDCNPGRGCTTLIQSTDSTCTLTACLQTPLPNGITTATVTVSGTFTGTLQFEQSADYGRTWIGISGYPQPTGAAATSTTSTGVWVFNPAARTNLRVRASAFASGAAITTIVYSGGGGSSSGGAGSFAGLSSGTNTTAAMVVGTGASLTATGTGSIVATEVVGSGGSVAGRIALIQGTAPSLTANAISIYAPATITTGFGWVMPSAECSVASILKSSAPSSNINTISCSALTLAELPATARRKTWTVITGDPGSASPALADDNDTPVGIRNDTGAAVTITGVACWADAGSPTVTPILTGGAADSILTGALTCGTAGWAAGTLNGTPTLNSFTAGAPATCSSTPCTIDANITSAGGVAKYIVLAVTYIQ